MFILVHSKAKVGACLSLVVSFIGDNLNGIGLDCGDKGCLDRCKINVAG